MKSFVAKYGTALAGLAVLIFLVIFARNFASQANLLNVLKQTSFLTILSVGFTFALITSELDLSFASLCSLAAVVTGGLVHAEIAWPLAALAGLGVALAGGALNGFLVTAIKVPSLIATLGTASIAGGVAFMITGGVAFVGRWDATFLSLARGKLFGIPTLIFFMAAVVLIAWFVANRTKLGVHMLATGEAQEAAHRAGIATRRMKLIGLTLSGLAAGIAAVLLVSNLSSAAPQMAGDFLMNGIAAVLLGMTMFQPGRPNIAGSFVGALTIAVLANGLVLLGAPYYLQDIMLGVIVIGSVSVSASVLKKAAFAV
ncbi:ABC transporter permease [Oceanibacterium hippocampi]|uniref:Ribose transport system permease protein RbsC n=1 Tax=Oceanibacterium hippocampi TaxID=745714 RepID=A0A1Y5SAS2_9PROT|nr:ABC transporter permease [Oceanibacterium hippocampi]SLN36368.1 Ribose transport system permease protein RbsC [Oceanibacterium hippocampi]